MNTNAFFRSTMANHFTAKKFFKRVASDIERQLKEWHEDDQVTSETWRTYSLCVQRGEITFRVALSKNLVDILQHEAPYALDATLWNRLIKQGLELEDAEGNYQDIALDFFEFKQQKLA